MRYELTALRLREALHDADLSQQQLADKSHIGKSSISHYINGLNVPGHKSAYALGQVLNVNPLWLMGLDVPKATPIPDEIIVEYAEKITRLPIEEKKHLLKYIDFILERGGDDNVAH